MNRRPRGGARASWYPSWNRAGARDTLPLPVARISTTLVLTSALALAGAAEGAAPRLIMVRGESLAEPILLDDAEEVFALYQSFFFEGILSDGFVSRDVPRCGSRSSGTTPSGSRMSEPDASRS